MGKSCGRHRAQRSRRWSAGGTAATVAAAGVAATVVGLTPTLVASPQLLAQTYYLRGTNIGDEPTDAEFTAFMGRVFAGTATVPPSGPPTKIDYNAGFWPVSHGGLDDLKWDASVSQGAALLADEQIGDGDVVFAFSQGAVAASKYKGEHANTGATFVLVENPNRANGGVLSRFAGLKIPILDVTFSGATPDNGDLTLDIARQYSGWSDFPTYPLNLLATANAVLGIVYLHGPTQRVEDLEAQLAAIPTDDPDYYQQHGNTTYYLIPTDRLPLLRPFGGIVPEPILVALNEPLRVLVETGYDRTDYSTPTRAQLLPKIDPVELTRDLADATAAGVAKGLASAGISPAPAATADQAPDSLAAPDLGERREAQQAATTLTADDDAGAGAGGGGGETAEAPAARKAPGAKLRKALRDLAPKIGATAEQRAERKAERAAKRETERATASEQSEDRSAPESDDKSEPADREAG
ncbi:PE-PPE domain-containing protein [Mycolicibacterium sp.]|uniref:PE-PPE domain-containing protein n=1 Tax=Mycolicibacterium sp. TaxID=2320850 RepID=UPI00355ECCD2